MNNRQDYFVPIKVAAFRLGISENDLFQWALDEHQEISQDYLNRITIRKSFITQCSYKKTYFEKLKSSINSEHVTTTSESTDTIKSHTKERHELLNLYESLINSLINIHKKYRSRAESHGFGSPVLAAYLLFSRAIATLSCLCDNIRAGYGYTGSMLRDIDETLDVALYFVVISDKEKCKTDLHNWYYLGESPSHSTCRQEIAKYNSNTFQKNSYDSEHDLMRELYTTKSKFTHPTITTIRDCCPMSFEQDAITIHDICYKKSKNETKLLGMTHFTKSSIWTCFQQFLLIFHHSMPLEKEDINMLAEKDKFMKELDRMINW